MASAGVCREKNFGKENRAKMTVCLPLKCAWRHLIFSSSNKHKNLREQNRPCFAGFFVIHKICARNEVFFAMLCEVFRRRLSVPARQRQSGCRVKALLSGVAVFFIVL